MMDWQKEQLKVARGVTDGSPKQELLFEVDGEMLTLNQIAGVELFNFQEATGCNTAAEFKAKQEQGEPVAQTLRDAVFTVLEGFTLDNDVRKILESAYYTTPQQRLPLPLVEGDLLPQVGSKVLIHLARQKKWVEHTVVGYYVWGGLDGLDERMHRVFVRVVDADGILNARMLRDVRPIEAAHGIKE